MEQLVALRAHNPKALKRFALVRIQLPLQTKELITLWLMGSKPSMEYGVWSTVERSTGGFYAGKWETRLRFESFLFYKIENVVKL